MPGGSAGSVLISARLQQTLGTPYAQSYRDSGAQRMFAVYLGSTLLLHAVYSSYEWHNVHKQLAVQPPPGLPRDVLVELGVALLVVVLGAVRAHVAQMDPVRVADLNSRDTREGRNPYYLVETRPHFQDFAAKRREYLQWRREQDRVPEEAFEKSAESSSAESSSARGSTEARHRR